MATVDRPDAVKLTHESQLVRAFYASLPVGEVPVNDMMAPVMRGEIRTDRITARIREAALHVVEVDPSAYPARCRGYAVDILRRIGRKTGRKVNPEGGRKKPTITVYPDDVLERERFAAVAEGQGLSLAAWALSVLRIAADAADKGE